MPFQEKQLGQSMGTGSPASIYSPAASTTAVIRSVAIANWSTKEVECWIWQDDDGSTYNNSTVVFPGCIVKPKKYVQLDVFWPMNNSSGNIAIQGAGCTFTLWGAEVT